MKTLIFGTTYVDSLEKQRIARLWTDLNNQLNPGCDYMLVDSDSPLQVFQPGRNFVMNLDGNIGHLSRGGRDGWGRAFCAGLQYAIDHGYDFVAHVEGDSLLRRPLVPEFERMRALGNRVSSVPVRGTKRPERNWIETGLMLFDVQWLQHSRLIQQYDWPRGENKSYPTTPEWHLYQSVLPWLYMLPWSAERGDCGQITAGNAATYDWITHVGPDAVEVFASSVMVPA